MPKPVIDEVGLHDEVELEVRSHSVVIRPVADIRNGWAEAARQLAASGEAGLVAPLVATRFDEEKWAMVAGPVRRGEVHLVTLNPTRGREIQDASVSRRVAE